MEVMIKIGGEFQTEDIAKARGFTASKHYLIDHIYRRESELYFLVADDTGRFQSLPADAFLKVMDLPNKIFATPVPLDGPILDDNDKPSIQRPIDAEVLPEPVEPPEIDL